MMLIKIKTASFIIVLLSIVALSNIGAQAQSVAEEDPVSRAIERIRKITDERVLEAERMLAASKLVDERAEAEHTTLRPKVDRDLSNMPSGKSMPIKLPGSILSRFNNYKESLSRILEEENVPVELLAVAFVESGFNPMALSPKGARGIWQFMPSTARRYGLRVEPISDHRTDPEHSTRAAARYLRDLYRQFGDWKLALAAYNTGENRIQRIIDRTGIRDFDEMARRGYIPEETRNYVPSVMSVWSRLNSHGWHGQARKPGER
jgi:hypothetical protein